MEDNWLVSVIIPVYNVESFLPEALSSVCDQTYTNLEILVIDDGSTDLSGVICDEYAIKDSRVKVIHQVNRGLSAARNVGLNIMHGDAVAFLDPDDKYLPNYILSMISAMQDKDVDVVICKNVAICSTEKLELMGNTIPEPSIPSGIYSRIETLQARADGSINPNVWNKLYNRRLWKDIRFPEGHVYEDIATIHLVLNLCVKIFVLEDVLYIRRIRRGSITRTMSEKNTTDYLWALTQFEEFVELNMPHIFRLEHLKYVRRLRLHQLLIYYCMCLKRNDTEKHLESTRKQIVDYGQDIIAESNIKLRIAYGLIRACPFLFRILLPLYFYFHNLFHHDRRCPYM